MTSCADTRGPRRLAPLWYEIAVVLLVLGRPRLAPVRASAFEGASAPEFLPAQAEDGNSFGYFPFPPAALRGGGVPGITWRLRRMTRWTLRLWRFALVGASGLVVNTAVLALLIERAGFSGVPSAFLAIELSIAWNYLLCDAWVFRQRATRGCRLWGLVSFAAVNNTAFVFSAPLLWLLTSVLEMGYLAANAISIMALTVVRFVVADTLIWSARDAWHVVVRAAPRLLRPATVIR
jgi:putative flippase GtrA